ncbi:methyltransferase [Fulvivirgaceae bacterium PWU4]|uniref:Methyltransferase n=1 Tax=Chryseosolibacter histidini TaxID=2782349 RepID=A0AAP2DGK3_9BACT|nr:hypothetical protein [Chryseosolibacter histidini]MBT1695915.1 methyltransferase [Chryseosolibacter histidini]
MIDDVEIGLGDIIKLKPHITYNNNRTYPNGKKAPDGIEIRFGTTRPIPEVREILKAHGFQFSEKQTMWYALDNAKSRELAQKLSETEVDVDDTQYEKRNFWVGVKSIDEFERLRERTEFSVKSKPPKYFYSKSFLKKAYPSISSLISDQSLSYKKYYNKVIGEGGIEEPQSNQSQSLQPNEEVAKKLQALADGMQKQIDSKINPAISKLRPTKRRMGIAAVMRDEGYELKELQTFLYALADAHRSGKIVQFPYLQLIRTRTQASLVYWYEYTEENYSTYKEQLSKLGISNKNECLYAREQRTKLLEDFSPTNSKEQIEKEQKLKNLEMRAFEAKIPGFFPTPTELIQQLLELADIQGDDRILEPSAGKGDLLDAVRESHSYHELHAIEPHSILREILTLKGYQLVDSDFLKYNPGEGYDKIIMNPPFEDGQDVDHVRHAFTLLKPGGRVVFIMSEGPFFRQFKKDKAFREFLQVKNAFVSEPLKEAFKNAFNSTSITVRVVAIDADGRRQPTSAKPQTDDMALLELEAEAELELLKMRVEQERRAKKAIQGFGEIPLDENKLQRFRRKAWAMQEQWEVLNFK